MSDAMQVILVVEDEVAIADLLQIVLEDAGYRVVIAGDGREALRCLAAEMPALVLSDVMLPLLDGRELARTMQTDLALRDIPLILMSAAGPGIIRGVPYTAFVPKPFQFDELLGTVERILAARDKVA